MDILIPILMWLSLPGVLDEIRDFPCRWLTWRRSQRFSSPAYDRWYRDIDTTTNVMAHDDWDTKANKKGNKR